MSDILRLSRTQLGLGFLSVVLARWKSLLLFQVIMKYTPFFNILLDGAADRSGLVVGDQILSINSQDVSDCTHDSVVTAIKEGSNCVDKHRVLRFFSFAAGSALQMRVRGAPVRRDDDRYRLVVLY